MNRDKGRTYCTLLAVTAPLAHFSGVGYMAVVLAAGAMLPLTVLAGDGLKRITKVEAAVELLWLGMVLGALLRKSGANWPGSRAEVVVPLTILLLAATTGNRERSVRCCNTLFWLVLIPAVLVLAVAGGRIEAQWLKPEPRQWTGGLIAALLWPALNGTEGNGKNPAGTGLAASAMAVLIQGGLSLSTAETMDSPLYELGRCVGNGGFEIIISIVLTIGWYAFASMGMGVAEAFGKKLQVSSLQSRISMCAIGASVILAGGKLKDRVLIPGCLILWILVPLLHPKNNLKKDEKRC